MPNWKDYIENADDFYGRKNELATIKQNWNSIFAIAGAKRIGKTSLLKHLEYFWHSVKGMPLPVYVNMLLFDPKHLDPRDAWLGMLGRELLRNDSINSPSNLPKLLDYHDFVDLLSGVLVNQIKDSSQSYQGVVFLIDEAQKLLDYSEMVSSTCQTLKEVEKNLKYNLGIVFAGLRGIHDFKEAYGSRLSDKAILLRLGSLDEEATRQIVKHNFDEEHVAEIIRLSGGHPFLVHALREQKRCGAKEPEQMARRFLLSNDVSTLDGWWQGKFGLNENERSVYRDLMNSVSSWDEEISVNKIKSMSEINAINALRALYTHGFLRSESFDGTYKMGAVLLRDFVKMKEQPLSLPPLEKKNKVPLSGVKVFVSYSHTDVRFVDENKSSLLSYLRGLERKGVTFWWDKRLTAGDFWDERIKEEMGKADIAIVLISQAFLNSSYCMDVEAQSFIESRASRGLSIIPIVLSACNWEDHNWLRKTMFFPLNGKNIERHYQNQGKRKELYLEIFRSVEKVCEKHYKSKKF